MGVVYKIRCERCGTQFEHQAGIGLVFVCVGCGESGDELSPFFCPVCNKKYDPRDDGFSNYVSEVHHWD